MVHRVSLGDIAEHEVCPRRYYLGRTGAARLRSTTSILNGAVLEAVRLTLLGIETSTNAVGEVGEEAIVRAAQASPEASPVLDIRLGLSGVDEWVNAARRRWAVIVPRLLVERAYTNLPGARWGETLQLDAMVRIGPGSEIRLRPFVVKYADDGAVLCLSWLAGPPRESADDPALLAWASALFPGRPVRIVRFWLEEYRAERVPADGQPFDVAATVARVEELAARLELGAAAFPTLEDDAKPCRRCVFRPTCRGEVPRG